MLRWVLCRTAMMLMDRGDHPVTLDMVSCIFYQGFHRPMDLDGLAEESSLKSGIV